jgi:hypothetical protein
MSRQAIATSPRSNGDGSRGVCACLLICGSGELGGLLG